MSGSVFAHMRVESESVHFAHIRGPHINVVRKKEARRIAFPRQ